MIIVDFVYLLVFVINVAKCGKPIEIAILLDNETDQDLYKVIDYIARRHQVDSKYVLTPQIINVKDMDSLRLEQTICNNHLAQRGIHAIFGSSPNNDIVQSISRNLEIVQFQNFFNPDIERDVFSQEKPEETTIFNLYPEFKLFAKALAALVNDMDWRTYTIIYEDDNSLIRLQEVLKISQNDDFPVKIRKLLPGDDQRPLLKEMKLKSELNIILDCSPDKIIGFLQQASIYNLTGEYYNYILTSLDAHTLDFADIIDYGANITTLRLIDPNSEQIKYMVKDFKLMGDQYNEDFKATSSLFQLKTALIYDSLVIFLTAFEQLSLRHPPVALPQNCKIPEPSKDGFRIAEYIKSKTFENETIHGPISGPIRFDKFGRRINFKLEIIELIKDGFRLSANWFSENPKKLEYVVSEEERKQEFEKHITQKVFRVVSRIGAPYLMYAKPAKKGQILEGNARFEGFSMDIIDEIANILNFTYQFELVHDNNYGSYDPVKKEWNGLVRDILDWKADLAICDLTITYERGKAVDFSMPFMTLGISILFSKDTKQPTNLFAFMKPLSLDIWLYMATAFVVMSILIYVAARLAPQDWENPHPCDPHPKELENIWSLKNCFWLTMGSIMAQGCDILPKGVSTRTIAGMWWFFSLIITSSYTANLAAFLTNERLGPTIENAEDLAKQSEIKYGCLQGGATSTFFRDSNFSTYQKMWRSMQIAQPSVFESNNKDGVKRVISSKQKYAFLMESSTIEYEMERNCDLIQVGGWLDTKNYGIAMPMNSPYNAAISRAVLKMQEEQKLHKLKEKWWKEMYGGGQCGQEETSSDDSAAELGIDHVGGVFVVLLGGLGIALIIAIAEFLWNVRKVSVETQISPKEAFLNELKFAVDVSKRKKAVLKRNNS
ncbi:glutamate receptor ionotropic, kainate 2-like [Onthophagus taurus]|uniref:glutamate receptor ionotropic, kainate 2-like n=1 Tax=Onthophagus taurus TaxID=166361 RepID=UPI0039BE275C